MRLPPSILIVEDHILVQRLVAAALETLGYVALTADSADEAKVRIEQGLQPTLVITDIRMPGEMDGLQLARWIRSQCPGLPVILQTAYTEFQIDDFLVLHKPFTIAELAVAVRSLLEPLDKQEPGFVQVRA